MLLIRGRVVDGPAQSSMWNAPLGSEAEDVAFGLLVEEGQVEDHARCVEVPVRTVGFLVICSGPSCTIAVRLSFTLMREHIEDGLLRRNIGCGPESQAARQRCPHGRPHPRAAGPVTLEASIAVRVRSRRGNRPADTHYPSGGCSAPAGCGARSPSPARQGSAARRSAGRSRNRRCCATTHP